MASLAATSPLVDVQSSADTRRIAIDKVGIKGIRYPIQIRDKSGDVQTTVAELNMYVYLPQQFKGTHMSRFVEILERKKHLDVPSFKAMLPEMLERLESHVGQIEMRFTYFVTKSVLVSGVQSLMDYDVTFIGKCEDGVTDLQIKVVVPVTSLLAPARKKSHNTVRTTSAATSRSPQSSANSPKATMYSGSKTSLNRRRKCFVRTVRSFETPR